MLINDINVLAVIPARMGSSRFPGKPLKKILNKAMIEWVYRGVADSELVQECVIATCDREIFDTAEGFGAQAYMTSSDHERASDRVAEAVNQYEKEFGARVDVVLLVQGDEPMVNSEMVDQVLAPFVTQPRECHPPVANLFGPFLSDAEMWSKNSIKVLRNLDGAAISFSRAISVEDSAKAILEGVLGKQVCLIPFRRDFLTTYASLPPTPLEIIDSIDMWRVLEHGYRVEMISTKHQTRPVDTPQDLLEVSELMRQASS